jgi:fic family toxin-antitoxin system
MNEVVIDNLNIENMIYEIRGKQVMLDSDLAKLYQCKNGTKEINQAVKNNPDKFPERFSWKLNTSDSYEFLVKKFDQKIETRGGKYKNPRVFTEQGVAMLSTILKSKVATETSIRIMDAFVYMRKYISNNFYKNEKILINHENRILMLEESFDKLNEKQKINTLFYEGQIYDAYSLLMDILSKAKEEVIIIDNYAGKELLDIIKDISIDIKIVSSSIDSTLKKKYESQYSNVTFINNNTFHDRFIIIDRKELYNSGASFKDLGKKCFSLNKIEDKEYLENIIKKIGKNKYMN